MCDAGETGDDVAADGTSVDSRHPMALPDMDGNSLMIGILAGIVGGGY